MKKARSMLKRSRANAFESQYKENASRRRASLSKRLKLVLKHPIKYSCGCICLLNQAFNQDKLMQNFIRKYL